MRICSFGFPRPHYGAHITIYRYWGKYARLSPTTRHSPTVPLMYHITLGWIIADVTRGWDLAYATQQGARKPLVTILAQQEARKP